MGENPSRFEGSDLPVESVSWYDAIYFCNKFSKRCGLEPVYKVNGVTDVTKWNYKPHKGNSIYSKIEQDKSKNGYRLPTNAEWEMAARGGIEGGWDYKYSGSNDCNEVAWFGPNSSSKTHEIGRKKANAAGLYDMSGNVWEWVWDVGPYYDGNRYNRGGGWSSRASRCEVDFRSSSYADCQYDDFLGFRVVRSSSN